MPEEAAKPAGRPLLTSTTNPLVKRARALRQRKTRADAGLFVAEGIHPVGSAVEAGWEIETILYTPDVLESDFARQLMAARGAQMQPVSPAVMQSLAEKDNPQGILAIIRQKHIALSELHGIQRCVALVSPQDPGNVGTILRTVDATGADAVLLVDGGVDPYHPTCVRASMGALFWIPVVQTSLAELLEWAHVRTTQIIGTSAHAHLRFKDFAPTTPWILLFGSEQKGLSSAQLEACDAAISLPMYGRSSSLNLAVAAGILLYEFRAPADRYGAHT